MKSSRKLPIDVDRDVRLVQTLSLRSLSGLMTILNTYAPLIERTSSAEHYWRAITMEFNLSQETKLDSARPIVDALMRLGQAFKTKETILPPYPEDESEILRMVVKVQLESWAPFYVANRMKALSNHVDGDIFSIKEEAGNDEAAVSGSGSERVLRDPHQLDSHAQEEVSS